LIYNPKDEPMTEINDILDYVQELQIQTKDELDTTTSPTKLNYLRGRNEVLDQVELQIRYLVARSAEVSP
jgi:Asp-tRNA(Asn)/Glu-tRNA(Gln) amidotransferase C subunit